MSAQLSAKFTALCAAFCATYYAAFSETFGATVRPTVLSAQRSTDNAAKWDSHGATVSATHRVSKYSTFDTT